jgi:hypothetical protein
MYTNILHFFLDNVSSTCFGCYLHPPSGAQLQRTAIVFVWFWCVIAAFLKLWSADHKWSSGSILVVLLDSTLAQKRKKKINMNCVSHTVVQNLKQFAFKWDKSRVVGRTFWLIKVVPHLKKVWGTLCYCVGAGTGLGQSVTDRDWL